MAWAATVRWSMAVYERNNSPRYGRTADRASTPQYGEEVPIGDLFRRLSQDASMLVHDEIVLAKLELRDTVKSYAADASKLASAAGVALAGALALTAFLIIALGDLFNNYWLSALVVTVALLAIAAMLARGALAHMKRNSLAPEQTVRTLNEDKQWASHKARDFKRKLQA
ncbi:MAG: phage holin family protein [Gemmatimonadota bacterium]